MNFNLLLSNRTLTATSDLMNTSFNNSISSRLMDKFEVKILFGIIMGILCLITTLGNICVIYRYRKTSMVFFLGFMFMFHLSFFFLLILYSYYFSTCMSLLLKTTKVGNLFIISLAVADLIVGCFVMPLASIYAVTDVWTMSNFDCLVVLFSLQFKYCCLELTQLTSWHNKKKTHILALPVCQVWLSADYTASTASILNLFTLSLDRYWSITSPLKYLGKRTKSRALIMVSLAWSISLLWLLPIIGWPYVFNGGVRLVAADKCNTEYDKNIAFKVITAICNFYIPLIVMIAINTKIYLVIRKRYHNPIMKYTSSGGGASSSLNSSIKLKQRNSISNANNQYNLVAKEKPGEQETTHKSEHLNINTNTTNTTNTTSTTTSTNPNAIINNSDTNQINNSAHLNSHKTSIRLKERKNCSNRPKSKSFSITSNFSSLSSSGSSCSSRENGNNQEARRDSSKLRLLAATLCYRYESPCANKSTRRTTVTDGDGSSDRLREKSLDRQENHLHSRVYSFTMDDDDKRHAYIIKHFECFSCSHQDCIVNSILSYLNLNYVI
jgi:hypothetical protein